MNNNEETVINNFLYIFMVHIVTKPKKALPSKKEN